MSNTLDCIDITSELLTVHGGNKAKAAWNGAKRVYNAARPILKESAEVAKDVGMIGGVTYGAKKAWDELRGNKPAAPAGQE